MEVGQREQQPGRASGAAARVQAEMEHEGRGGGDVGDRRKPETLRAGDDTGEGEAEAGDDADERALVADAQAAARLGVVLGANAGVGEAFPGAEDGGVEWREHGGGNDGGKRGGKGCARSASAAGGCARGC